MVGSISNVIGMGKHPTDERCVSVEQALELGLQYETVPYSMVVIRARKPDMPSQEKYLAANVRVGDVSLTVHTRGCISEDYEDVEAPIVIECHLDTAQQCGNCILKLAHGEEIRKSMEPSFPFIFIAHDTVS